MVGRKLAYAEQPQPPQRGGTNLHRGMYTCQVGRRMLGVDSQPVLRDLIRSMELIFLSVNVVLQENVRLIVHLWND